MTVLPSVHIGPIEVSPPVVLAPMAGVTNYPFRALCRRFGAGLYISEMITARPLVEGREKTLKLADFGPDESPRSLYAVLLVKAASTTSTSTSAARSAR